MVPLLQRVTLEKRQSNQNAFAPPFGASPRLGIPSLRHCSGGPPPSAIHGRGRLPRHPCRGAPCATPAFGLWERGVQIKIKNQSKAKQKQDQKIATSLRSTAPTGKCVHVRSGRPVGRLAFDFDAPPPREAEWRFCAVGPRSRTGTRACRA
jgi:hypothetical protein